MGVSELRWQFLQKDAAYRAAGPRRRGYSPGTGTVNLSGGVLPWTTATALGQLGPFSRPVASCQTDASYSPSGTPSTLNRPEPSVTAKYGVSRTWTNPRA